jgi:hypothetical protein
MRRHEQSPLLPVCEVSEQPRWSDLRTARGRGSLGRGADLSSVLADRGARTRPDLRPGPCSPRLSTARVLRVRVGRRLLCHSIGRAARSCGPCKGHTERNRGNVSFTRRKIPVGSRASSGNGGRAAALVDRQLFQALDSDCRGGSGAGPRGLFFTFEHRPGVHCSCPPRPRTVFGPEVLRQHSALQTRSRSRIPAIIWSHADV